MSYHQGAEGGAIPKERRKDGSPNKDLDKTMDPDMKSSVHPDRAESVSSGCLSMKSGESMDPPLHFKEGATSQRKGAQTEMAESVSSGYLSMKSDQSMDHPFHFKGTGEVVCDICSEVQAVKFCLTCSVSYCETHIRQHYTIAALQRHTLVDVTGDLEERLCQHDYCPLDVFCRTDQMLICSQCAETNHKGHDTTLLKIKKSGRQPKSFDGDQHTTLTSDDVLPPPGDFQVLLLTLDSVSLSWSSPQGLTGPQTFRVTWGCDGETSSTRVKDVYHLKISSLKPGEKYQFSVATEGEDGRQSRWVSASLFTVVPPRDLKVEHLKDTSFILHWSKAEGMEKVPQRFLITFYNPGTGLHAENTKDCHNTFSNLQPGTEYTVSISTVLNNGEQSEPVFTTICTILPAPDQLTVDSVDTTSAAVSWNQPPGLDQTQHHYQISYHCPGTEPHITTTSSHSITLSDLQGGTLYSVTVCTVLENGKQSQLVSTTLTTVLPAPDQLTVDSVDTTSAAVSWSQPPGLDQTQHHYQISYHCPGTEPHITTTSSHSITLSDLQGGTQYSVTVCTVLENGTKSRLVSTTLTTVLPAPDQLTVDSVDITSAAVSWNQPPGLDQTQHHYQISYHCPGTEPHITTTSSHSITLSDLQCGTQYSVTVCTELENGKQSQLVSTTFTTKHNVRIVLLGKTRAGKSASGNTILGRKHFPSKFSSVSPTKDCNKVQGKVDGHSVTVIDTPGLFDTTLSDEEGLRRIAPCISLSAPGPHVFLVVIRLGRFTEEEQRTVEIIQKFMGDEASKYTMVLFTNGDNLDDETIEDLLLENPGLQSLVDQCKGGYHVFNNKDKNRSQVTELLEKINKMVKMNGGSHYTTDMFQEAERAIDEEKERDKKERENKEREIKNKVVQECCVQ
ncbi:fibronectin-like isoform X2 [Salvelinus fontinalis]|uniref:fibronectin-like isoform X2 n=1 Tax=Salvelinus fontinalis TaxID=8038 RepID=UPI002486054C|nr:fibronectin-like isoform X2 [Salvelinus fontinalis]